MHLQSCCVDFGLKPMSHSVIQCLGVGQHQHVQGCPRHQADEGSGVEREGLPVAPGGEWGDRLGRDIGLGICNLGITNTFQTYDTKPKLKRSKYPQHEKQITNLRKQSPNIRSKTPTVDLDQKH